MYGVIILAICAAALFLSLGYFFGNTAALKKTRSILTSNGLKDALGYSNTKIKGNQDQYPFIFGPIVFIIALLVMGGIEARDDAINKYRKGDIIENVQYTYQTIEGKKVLKDSLVTYKVYKKN